jgi:hypothetical protein
VRGRFPDGPAAPASSWLVLATAAFSIVFARLPVIAGGRLLQAAAFVPFVICLGWAGPRRAGRRSAPWPAFLAALLLGVVAIEMLRGASAGVYSSTTDAVIDIALLATIAVFATWLLTSAADEHERARRLGALALAPATYVAVNVALQALRGFLPFPLPENTTVATGTSATVLAKLGVYVTRVDFPLASGVNSFGAIAAAGLAASLTMLLLRVPHPPRALLIGSAAICLYGLLATDSRIPLAVTVLVVAALRLAPRLRPALPVALYVPFSAFLLLRLLASVAGLSSAEQLSRAGEDVASGNGREYVWEAVWHALSRFEPQQLVGWGAEGHITSGVSQHYAFVFPPNLGPTAFTTHNLALQTILDGGYLALALLVVVTFMTIKRLQLAAHQAPGSPAIGLVAATIVLVASGTTEALPTYNFMDTMVLFVMLVTTAAAAPVLVGERVPRFTAPAPPRLPQPASASSRNSWT